MSPPDCAAVLAIEEQQAFAWSKAQIQQYFNSPYSAFVVEEKGQIIGFALVALIADEGEIHNIAIDSQHQKKGFGKLLLNELLQFFHQQGVKTIYLEVRESNQAAIKLYQNAGFVVIGKRKDYYRTLHSFEDAILMQHRV